MSDPQMSRGAAIDARPTAVDHRDVRRDVAAAACLDEVSRVITAVATQRDRLRASQMLVEHLQRGLPPDDPGNPTVDFGGERRCNEPHESTADPEARLARKGRRRRAGSVTERYRGARPSRSAGP